MRRLYSTFAGGRPGIGLFLMRLVVGFVLVHRSGPTVLANPPIAMAIVSVLLVGAGFLLFVGLCTPFVGTLVALIETCRMVTVSTDRLFYLVVATCCSALAMLGPGLWSIDARLFGWKQIDPSPRKR